MGAVSVNPEVIFTATDQSRIICPGINGGKNWQAGAYSPLTNAMYYPLQNACMTATSQIDRPSLGSLYGFSSRNQFAPGARDRLGAVHAISAETGKTIWKYEQRAATTSLVATGGRLLFGGDANGRFRAFDQDTGKVLWEVNLGSAVTGYPITYAVGGRQFVAVSTGGSLATGGLNGLTPELRPGSSNTLFVFALPAN